MKLKTKKNLFTTGATKLHEGSKYHMSESMKNAYTWQLNLTIYNLQKSDFTAYTCTSVNALGKQETRIRLQGNYIFKRKLQPKACRPQCLYIRANRKILYPFYLYQYMLY